jgi:hypothetical protein
MATSHSMSKPRRRRKTTHNSRAGATSIANTQGTTLRIRGRLRQFLSSEQGFLLKTQSLLLCIAKSMDDDSHPTTGPYYPDVVELASDLIKQRIKNIDELLLDGQLSALQDLNCPPNSH